MSDLKYNIDKSDINNFKVSFSGQILGASDKIEKLINEIDDAIKQGILHCTVDLSKVEFMDSSGLSLLIRMLTKFRNVGGELVLSGISKHVEKLLLITKLNSIFGIK